jgi:hypothetical protein
MLPNFSVTNTVSQLQTVPACSRRRSPAAGVRALASQRSASDLGRSSSVPPPHRNAVRQRMPQNHTLPQQPLPKSPHRKEGKVSLQWDLPLQPVASITRILLPCQYQATPAIQFERTCQKFTMLANKLQFNHLRGCEVSNGGLDPRNPLKFTVPLPIWSVSTDAGAR